MAYAGDWDTRVDHMVQEKEEKKTRRKTRTKAAEEKPKSDEKATAPKEAPAEEKAEAAKEVPKEAEKPAEAAPKRRRKAAAKKTQKVFVARGKRKLCVARATIKAGKGAVRMNRMNVSSIPNHYVRSIITEPLRYVGPEANEIDVSVSVGGGGMMGQAQAARTAIAHALVLYFDQMNLKQKFASIDRSLLIEDTRRVESKKFRGPKARARFQKSYR